MPVGTKSKQSMIYLIFVSFKDVHMRGLWSVTRDFGPYVEVSGP